MWQKKKKKYFMTYATKKIIIHYSFILSLLTAEEGLLSEAV